jgi:hypothetical protein
MGPQVKASVGKRVEGDAALRSVPLLPIRVLLSSALQIGLPSKIFNKEFLYLETKFEKNYFVCFMLL